MMLTHGYEHMTADEFATALRSKARGSTFVYFTGHLAQAKHEVGPFEPQLTSVAALALAAELRGEVRLTQKRIGENNYQYRATIIRNPQQLSFTREQPRLAQSKFWML